MQKKTLRRYIAGFGAMLTILCASAFINLFSGSAGSAVCLFIIALIPLTALIFCLYKGSDRLFIDERGVQYVSKNAEYFIPWKDVGRIEAVIGYNRALTQKGVEEASYIWFKRKGCSKNNRFGENAFSTQYSKELTAEIGKYTNKPIEGLDLIEKKCKIRRKQK